ncbi:hypothetical protein [Nocardioides sp. TF02-7]|uniref:hypothetical protein n=1 Tax=Nocardioides sp. TF02-7 TaxID=2917724 RepID=UPI001F06C192|nr:hypothetical protein [Nocardioides sp. TF02-7]UMG91381.1 hypothetical protein MF408_14635 [Nocardioides sp. TF02-7]
MHQVVRAVVDVEQHDVVRRRRAPQGLADVVDDDLDPRVGEQRRPVRHRAVAQPLHERGLQLDDRAPRDPRVVEHRAEREPEAQPADEDVQRAVGARGEGPGRQRALGGVLKGVHHEHPVGAELEVAVVPAAQHQLAAARRAPGRVARAGHVSRRAR